MSLRSRSLSTLITGRSFSRFSSIFAGLLIAFSKLVTSSVSALSLFSLAFLRIKLRFSLSPSELAVHVFFVPCCQLHLECVLTCVISCAGIWRCFQFHFALEMEFKSFSFLKLARQAFFFSLIIDRTSNSCLRVGQLLFSVISGYFPL